MIEANVAESAADWATPIGKEITAQHQTDERGGRQVVIVLLWMSGQ
jgi:hypothetical protein